MKTFIGFGPPGLIEYLKTGKWDEIGNFPVIVLGGYCLTAARDERCSVKYGVAVEDEMGNTFSIEGYCFPDMIGGMPEGRPHWKHNKIGGKILCEKSDGENPCRYEISVVVIA